MKKIILAVTLAASAAITSPAFAANCTPGQQLVRLTVDTGGAVNSEAYSVLSSLLANESYSALMARQEPKLRKLLADKLVQPVAAGRVFCADPMPRWDYAKQVRLDKEGFSVFVRERDLVVVE